MVPAMNAPAAAATQRAYVNLTPGDPAPWFTQRLGEEGYAIHRAGGRYVVLCFFASAANEAGKAAMVLAVNVISDFIGRRGRGASIKARSHTERLKGSCHSKKRPRPGVCTWCSTGAKGARTPRKTRRSVQDGRPSRR